MIKYHTEAEKDLCEKRMGIVIRLIGLVLFAPVAFCVVQMCNGVFSVWNIFPSYLHVFPNNSYLCPPILTKTNSL